MKISKIRNDVPVPARKQYGLSSLLRKMEPGESITITEYDKENTVRATVYKIGKLEKRKYTTRYEKDGGLTIWRVK